MLMAGFPIVSAARKLVVTARSNASRCTDGLGARVEFTVRNGCTSR